MRNRTSFGRRCDAHHPRLLALRPRRSLDNLAPDLLPIRRHESVRLLCTCFDMLVLKAGELDVDSLDGRLLFAIPKKGASEKSI